MSDVDTLIRLALGAGVAFLIGLERSRRMQFVGARTFGLIGLAGAAAAITATQYQAGDPGTTGRVLQGVLVGVGFVGAGVIMHPACRRSIHGVTTAAAMWLAAVVGFASGTGAWILVAGAGALALLLLVVPEPLLARKDLRIEAGCEPVKSAADGGC
jgi:putative Mg2+ transporter-C (MgtC) family protein